MAMSNLWAGAVLGGHGGRGPPVKNMAPCAPNGPK